MAAAPLRLSVALSRALVGLCASALVATACVTETTARPAIATLGAASASSAPTVPPAAAPATAAPNAPGSASPASAAGPLGAASPSASPRAATTVPVAGASGSGAIGASTSAQTAPPSGGAVVQTGRLPVGDGRISTAPLRGSVFLCPRPGGGGGAQATGPWFGTDGTFDPAQKPVVSGQTGWPFQLQVSVSGALRQITGNGLPNHATGTYPVAASDAAYQYDRNPNSIRAYSVALSLPAVPTVATTATCLGASGSFSGVGILLSGAQVFDATDALGRDAVAHELLDRCAGHPERTGVYHYHDISACIDRGGTAAAHAPLVGYAIDGFGIFGFAGENGAALRNADLDECHGHAHAIAWDGASVVLYHYHATREYPYTLGCFRGSSRAGAR